MKILYVEPSFGASGDMLLAALVDLGVPTGPVIASIHEKRAELRAQIMEMGEMEQEPAQLGRRLRDARPQPTPR